MNKDNDNKNQSWSLFLAYECPFFISPSREVSEVESGGMWSTAPDTPRGLLGSLPVAV